MTKKSKKTRKPASPNNALDAVEASGKRLDDLSIEDALDEMKRRCFGLMSAIRGLDQADDEETRDGLLRFAGDITDAMERLAEAFKKERQLREAEERR